ncbi:acyl-CoA dehydrogenase family protein [Georgenia ruanii]|uniref:Acyl-CoA dehydrogenase n=1 Tax=Georgenia ruanii TaxID=348442 RepID=A0A7J9UX04_9MICO|nr:acyl-CoA dehydrogenase family protein [Georgenia ruanii]MPV89156.1 acyl-CoA dehydrogenase [Georgenia ruanii]
MTQDLLGTASALHVSDEFEPLMDRLEALVPLIKANGAANEDARRLGDDVVAALHESGVFRMGIPVSLGGYECSPRQVIAVIEKLAYADASTGWSAMALQMESGTTAAYLSDEATEQLYADGGYELMAGQGTRPDNGRAHKVKGGYLLSGSWNFASGVPHAGYIHTAALVEGTGEAMIFTLPKAQTTVVDNWNVMGLRATGSHDYIIEDAFVPDAFVYPVGTKEPLHGGALYSVGLANMAGMNHAGWALGVGRRMLEEMAALARRKSGAPGAGVDTAQFHADFAEAEAKLRAARAFVMDVWADNEAALARGELLSTEQETLTRLALNHATWSAHAVGMTVYTWAGTAALRTGDLQRYFRDLHAGTQHVTSGPVVLQQCGKALAGLAKNPAWQFFSLVERGERA